MSLRNWIELHVASCQRCAGLVNNKCVTWVHAKWKSKCKRCQIVAATVAVAVAVAVAATAGCIKCSRKRCRCPRGRLDLHYSCFPLFVLAFAFCFCFVSVQQAVKCSAKVSRIVRVSFARSQYAFLNYNMLIAFRQARKWNTCSATTGPAQPSPAELSHNNDEYWNCQQCSSSSSSNIAFPHSKNATCPPLPAYAIPYSFIVVFWRAVLPLLRLVGFATRPGSNFVRLNYFILFHVAAAAASAATRCRLPG